MLNFSDQPPAGMGQLINLIIHSFKLTIKLFYFNLTTKYQILGCLT